jgi:hypothetical protein
MICSQAAIASDIPQDALDGWDRLKQAISTDLKGRFRYTRSATVPDKEAVTGGYLVQFAGNPRGTLIRREDENGVARVTAANGDYGFDATQGKAKGAFQMTGDIRRGLEEETLEKSIRDIWKPHVGGCVEILAKTMPDLVSSDFFELTSLDVDAGSGSATMEFNYSSKGEATDTAIRGGTITFAIGEDWAIRKYNCRTPWGRIEGSVEARKFRGSYVPAQLEVRMYGEKAQSALTETYTLEEISELPSTEHLPTRLEDYGLTAMSPEIVPAPVTGTSKWRVLALNGVLIALVGGAYVYFRRRGRR